MFLFDLFTYIFSPIHIEEEKSIPIKEQIVVQDTITKNKITIKKIQKINNNIPFKLKPYKDYLFRYVGGIIKTEYNGDITWIDYDMYRDIEDRDIIDVDRVFDKYVELLPESFRQEKSIHSPYGTKYYREVKRDNIKNKDVKIVLLYFHGMGGNRHQGINDYTFGGNFNRIQNLMVKNNGVYISTDFTDFYGKGSIDMRILVYKLRNEYPNAKIMLSGASSGGTLIWNMLHDKKIQKIISGILLIGSVVSSDHDIYNTNIPIYIGHGTRDPNITYLSKYTFYKDLKGHNYNYPIKIEFFKGGVHGTPIRMINWKDSINWILDKNNN